ncbi:MAG: D-alanyl-D-alanine carboxypeptidase [Prochlorotrichaceae cyanobacterium]|jgi:D-alanyl-D-alanine carboxypeptidase/D-alanyl-D-alanine-endopeptidase (penicillin-binding protein 4)
MKQSHLSYLGIGVICALASFLWYFDRFPRSFSGQREESTTAQGSPQTSAEIKVIPSAPPTPPPLQIDPELQTIVDAQLANLKAAGFDPAQQGVWIESNRGTFAEFQGNTPLAVASLTKLATTLTALQTWPTDYQFYTRVLTQGTIANGTLTGDLIIQGGADPFYVWESAILLGNRLNQLGIQTVTGSLIIEGLFVMNFERDPAIAGELFRQALNADFWPNEALLQYQNNLPADTPQPRITIAGETIVRSAPTFQAGLTTLVEQPSLPLVQLLKQMNNYSNNIMAQLFADLMGGAPTLQQTVVQVAQVPSKEVAFSNGSGLGHENQISAQGSCKVIKAIEEKLEPQGFSVSDIMPISQRDPGTLSYRNLPPGLTAKTGTLWDVSTLAGVLSATDQPVKQLDQGNFLCFAILNRGANIDFFYQAQEDFVGELKTYLQKTSSGSSLQSAL